jgi:hypothetical protein
MTGKVTTWRRRLALWIDPTILVPEPIGLILVPDVTSPAHDPNLCEMVSVPRIASIAPADPSAGDSR